VNSLDEKGIELRNLLTSDPKAKLSGIRRTTGKEAIRVGHHVRDVRVFDPDVAHEITLRTDGNGNLIVGTESTDVIHTLGLHGEVGVTLVILTEESHLRLTSDVHVLSTH